MTQISNVGRSSTHTCSTSIHDGDNKKINDATNKSVRFQPSVTVNQYSLDDEFEKAVRLEKEQLRRRQQRIRQSRRWRQQQQLTSGGISIEQDLDTDTDINIDAYTDNEHIPSYNPYSSWYTPNELIAFKNDVGLTIQWMSMRRENLQLQNELRNTDTTKIRNKILLGSPIRPINSRIDRDNNDTTKIRGSINSSSNNNNNSNKIYNENKNPRQNNRHHELNSTSKKGRQTFESRGVECRTPDGKLLKHMRRSKSMNAVFFYQKLQREQNRQFLLLSSALSSSSKRISSNKSTSSSSLLKSSLKSSITSYLYKALGNRSSSSKSEASVHRFNLLRRKQSEFEEDRDAQVLAKVYAFHCTDSLSDAINRGRYDAREAGYHSDDSNHDNNENDDRDSFLTRKNNANYQNIDGNIIIKTDEGEKSRLSVMPNSSICDKNNNVDNYDDKDEESICSENSTESSYSVAISVTNTSITKRASKPTILIGNDHHSSLYSDTETVSLSSSSLSSSSFLSLDDNDRNKNVPATISRCVTFKEEERLSSTYNYAIEVETELIEHTSW